MRASAAFACVLQPGPTPVAEMATVPMQLAALHKAAQRGDEQEVAALLDQVRHVPGPGWACRGQHLQRQQQQNLWHALCARAAARLAGGTTWGLGA